MKELKLKNLQEKFAGTIKKVSNKYVVTFPNSQREYTYKCNLKQLAEKLNINISGLLADDCTYNTGKKSDINRWREGLNNQEKASILLKENLNLLPDAITELYNKCSKEPYNSLERKEINFSLYLIINLKTEKVTIEIKAWEVWSDIKIPTTAYKHYYQIATLSNKVNKIKNDIYTWDTDRLNELIEDKVNYYKS